MDKQSSRNSEEALEAYAQELEDLSDGNPANLRWRITQVADKLRALKKALVSEQQRIPEGWQLVPKQMTRAMAEALENSEGGDFHKNGLVAYWQVCWADTLKAAPQPAERHIVEEPKCRGRATASEIRTINAAPQARAEGTLDGDRPAVAAPTPECSKPCSRDAPATPKTDAFVLNLIPSKEDAELGLNPYMVMACDLADFARQLERELAEANEKVAGLRGLDMVNEEIIAKQRTALSATQPLFDPFIILLASMVDEEGKRCESLGYYHDAEKVRLARAILKAKETPVSTSGVPEKTVIGKDFENLTGYRNGYWGDQIRLIANGRKSIEQVASAFNAALASAALSARQDSK